MKEYLLFDRCADLAILITGGLKPEYYIRERLFFISIFDQVLNALKTNRTVSLLNRKANRPVKYHNNMYGTFRNKIRTTKYLVPISILSYK